MRGCKTRLDMWYICTTCVMDDNMANRHREGWQVLMLVGEMRSRPSLQYAEPVTDTCTSKKR